MNNNKICTLCNIEKNINEFHYSYNICKQCRNKIKQRKKIEKRQPYRDKLKKACNDEGISDEKFNKFFIPLEKYKVMKDLPDIYSFCECNDIRKMDKKHF